MNNQQSTKESKTKYLLTGGRVIILLLLAFLFSGCGNKQKADQIIINTQEQNTTQQEVAQERDKKIIPFSEKGQLATLAIEVHGFENTKTISGAIWKKTQAKQDTIFVLVDASFTNTTGQTFTLYPSGILLTDSGGITYNIYQATSGGAIGYETRAIDGRDLGHNIEERGVLVYEVPVAYKPYALEIEKKGTNEVLQLLLNDSKNDDLVEVDYQIVEEDDISYTGCKRITLRIIVPDEAEKSNINFTLKAIGEEYASAWDSVTIWAWGYSEKNIVGESAFTKGMYEKFSKAGCK